jgi:hypothetical protein
VARLLMSADSKPDPPDLDGPILVSAVGRGLVTQSKALVTSYGELVERSSVFQRVAPTFLKLSAIPPLHAGCTYRTIT